jgi:hypothetical protein
MGVHELHLLDYPYYLCFDPLNYSLNRLNHPFRGLDGLTTHTVSSAIYTSAAPFLHLLYLAKPT